MTRTDYINEIIKRNGYKTYLEIGVGDPEENFTLIDCEEKTGVDPYFNMDDCLVYDNEKQVIIDRNVKFRMTSDEFFSFIGRDTKYDVIFIDGLHTEEQCDKDIQNALEHISDDGIILVHDTNPYYEYMVAEYRERGVAWTGDVYKSISKLKHLGVPHFTYGGVLGLTAIKKPNGFIKREDIDPVDLPYENFAASRKEHINLVSEEDFFKMATNPKVCLCCIVKMENLYLRDFIEYHKKMGVSQVILYDNNDENGEYPQQVIGDYIESGYVIYKNVRGRYRCQLECYSECYNKYNTNYDWMVFIDVDEFIDLYEDRNLQQFLTREKFNPADIIFLYWVQYGDNGLLHYDKRPVWERFTEHIDQTVNRANTFKVLIRCNIGATVNFIDANAFSYTMPDKKLLICDAAGREIHDFNSYVEWNYDCAALRHYQTLTIDEFLCRRFGRKSYADKASSFNEDTVMGIFWQLNERTPEKEKIISDFFETYQIEEDNV